MDSSNFVKTNEQLFKTALSSTDLPLYMTPCATNNYFLYATREITTMRDPLLQLSQVSHALFSATKDSIGRLRRIHISPNLNKLHRKKTPRRVHYEWRMEHMEPKTKYRLLGPNTAYLINREFIRLVPSPPSAKQTKKRVLIFF